MVRTNKESSGIEQSFTGAQYPKVLMVLGLLLTGDKHGYELHRIISAHAPLNADFKKPTLYFLLSRLADTKLVSTREESGARGPEKKRFVYSITEAGRAALPELLKKTIVDVNLDSSALEVAMAFCTALPSKTVQSLLLRRRRAMEEKQAALLSDLQPRAGRFPPPQAIAVFLAGQHAAALMAADIGWISRAVTELKKAEKSWRKGPKFTSNAGHRTGSDRPGGSKS